MTTRSAPVSTFVIVTVAPGSTPPEPSTTVPSMVPLAACDCANAGAASDTDSSAERRILSILGVYNAKLSRFPALAVETKHFVGRIHFFEVMAKHDAAGDQPPGDGVAGIAKSEQVVRKVSVGADAGQAVRAARVVGGPSVRGLQTGDIRIQGRELAHQLPGALHDRLLAQARRRRVGIGAANQQPIAADPADR